MKNQITFLILFILRCFSSLQAQVTQEWVARYSGSPNHFDEANSLAVDGSGNIYVTGHSGVTGDFDYATIKYNPSGVQQWVQRYDAPGNGGNDYATSLAVGGSGNVYVTGSSDSGGFNTHYLTIKYNSSGDSLWVARYKGPVYGGYAYSLAVDDSENVYVTGYSNVSETSFEYATIKYNSSGVQQWILSHGLAAPEWWLAPLLAVDGLGNVYVAVSSPGIGGFDYATIKYNSSGVQQWAQIYNGPGNNWDFANSLAVDGSGNVYVTGESYGSGTSSDYATIKYNSSGDSLWVARYRGPGNSGDAANSLAVDGSGNVYVTGTSWGSGGSSEYATIKYNSSGDSLWVQRYNGPGNGWDLAHSLAIDGSGNVYVTGESAGSGTGDDYATIKYNSSGVQQWIQRYHGEENDRAYSLAVDGSGNVYVTGNSGNDYATIKYSQTDGITAPTSLEAQSVDSSYLKITWQDNSNDEDGFYIERTQINDSSHWEVIDAVPQNVNQYSDYLVTRSLKYYYRVNAYSGNIHSGYSNTDSAILGGDPSFIPSAPSNLMLVKRTANTIIMDWQDNSNNEYGFIILRKSDQDLFFRIIDSVNTDVVTYQEVGLNPNLNYSYKICSYNSYGISDYSNTLIVLSKSSPNIKTPELSGNHILYGNYPNPFNPVTNLEFGISSAAGGLGFVSLKIYDMLGKEVATLVNDNLTPGTYKYIFDASALPSGVYFYKLAVDGNIIDTKRMMLLK